MLFFILKNACGVEEHLGLDVVKHLIISPDKSLLKGGYLIDDYASGEGQGRFEGQLIHYGQSNFQFGSLFKSMSTLSTTTP